MFGKEICLFETNSFVSLFSFLLIIVSHTHSYVWETVFRETTLLNY